MQKSWSLLSLLLVAGCARLPQPTSNPASGADAAFNGLADEYLEGYFAWRPLTATALGLHQHDGQITDFSPASVEAERERLQTFEHRLADLNTNQLSALAFYDYRILENAIRRELFSFDGLQIYSQNPMTYASALDVNTYVKRNFAPLEDRARAITAILKQAPQIIAAAHANLAGSLPRPQVETAIDEANGAVDFLSKDLVTALKPITDEGLMAEFNAANSRALDEWRKFAVWLKDEKLPKANDHYALGRDKYLKLLAYGEMLTLPPEQLLEIGRRELRLKQQVFAETAARIDPARKPMDVFQAIQKDHPAAEGLISDTAKDLEAIRQFVIDRDLVRFPSQVRAQVTETPQYLRATSFASMDTPGPFETKATEAYYYVTPTEPDWSAQQKEEWLTAFNYYTTDIVSIHEAYPGHYVQFLCLNASPASRLEKIFGSYAFIEGWAHYCEQMMVDEGFGRSSSPARHPDDQIKAAKYLLAQTDEALLRICRLCVSIKMHCQGMTVEEATRFFQENCYYELKPARQEAMRGAFDPEYLYYTLGKLEILKLREDYRKQEGASFTLQKFHHELLRHGEPPLRLLREVMLRDQALWPKVL